MKYVNLYSRIASTRDTCTLISIKNRGKLLYPSNEITKTSESVIRSNSNILFTQKNILSHLITKTFHLIITEHNVFNDNIMNDHIQKQAILNNHKVLLIKEIIGTYIQLRLYHEAKCASAIKKDENIRHKYTKLILFRHQ